MDEWLVRQAAKIQESWIGEKFIRYEDLLSQDVEILERVLVEQCGLDLPAAENSRSNPCLSGSTK